VKTSPQYISKNPLIISQKYLEINNSSGRNNHHLKLFATTVGTQQGQVRGCFWCPSGGLLFWVFLPLEGIIFGYQIQPSKFLDDEDWPRN